MVVGPVGKLQEELVAYVENNIDWNDRFLDFSIECRSFPTRSYTDGESRNLRLLHELEDVVASIDGSQLSSSSIQTTITLIHRPHAGAQRTRKSARRL
jgi:hypothetical protein